MDAFGNDACIYTVWPVWIDLGQLSNTYFVFQRYAKMNCTEH